MAGEPLARPSHPAPRPGRRRAGATFLAIGYLTDATPTAGEASAGLQMHEARLIWPSWVDVQWWISHPTAEQPVTEWRSLLDADPALARTLQPAKRAAARPGLPVRIIRLPAGKWSPPRAPRDSGDLGYIVLRGVILRELSVPGGTSVELLKTGDLLRPWDDDTASFAIAEWHVCEPVELASLDRSAASRLGRWPELLAAVLERSLRRSRSLAVHAAIQGVRGLEGRLLVFFWHMAERWGSRVDGATLVPIRLTHQTLAELIGARRPSVTGALADLRRAGLVSRCEGGWLLRGEAPGADTWNHGVRSASDVHPSLSASLDPDLIPDRKTA